MTDDFKKEFGLRLKLLRKENGLTQQQLSDLVSCSQATVARIEAGERMADVYLVRCLIDRLKCDVVWLLTGRGEL